MGRPKEDKTLIKEYLFNNYNIDAIKNPKQYKSRFIPKHIDDVEIIIKAVKDFYNWDNVFFRGQKYKNWRFSSSIARNKSLIKYENDMFTDLYDSKFDFNNVEKCREKIFYAQHYGLPTRMLDVTSNWEIALWFACQEILKCNGENHDGEIVLMNVDNEIDENVEKFFYWQIENSNSLCGSNYDGSVKTYSKLISKDYKLVNQKIDNYGTGVTNLYLLKPNKIDGRIKRQSAYGVLLPSFEYKGKFRQHIRSVFRKNMVSVCIPGYLKDELLNELNILGINENYIYEITTNKEKQFESKCLEIRNKYLNIEKGAI